MRDIFRSAQCSAPSEKNGPRSPSMLRQILVAESTGSSLSPIARKVMGFSNIDTDEADPRKAVKLCFLLLIVIGRVRSVPLPLLSESKLCEHRCMLTCENKY